MKLGIHQKRALAFVKQNPGWHSYAKDFLTNRVVLSLEKRGLVEISKISRQFRIKG
jgi:hypothetical protein